MNKRFLKVGEVAEFLGVSVCTVWRWLKRGIIPAPVKLGGSTAWIAEEISVWFETRPRLNTNEKAAHDLTQTA